MRISAFFARPGIEMNLSPDQLYFCAIIVGIVVLLIVILHGLFPASLFVNLLAGLFVVMREWRQIWPKDGADLGKEAGEISGDIFQAEGGAAGMDYSATAGADMGAPMPFDGTPTGRPARQTYPGVTLPEEMDKRLFGDLAPDRGGRIPQVKSTGRYIWGDMVRGDIDEEYESEYI